MDQLRPGQSNTLPRNFMFHSTDSHEPQTPKQIPQDVDVPPPPPQPATYGPRRRINLYKHTEIPWLIQHHTPIHSPDIPIPSIELFPEPDSNDSFWNQQSPDTPSNRLRVPSYRLIPPKTPPAQIQPSLDEPHHRSWMFGGSHNEAGFSIQRPTSACSHLSDSSISSNGSFISGPSFGGSCTSPESDFQDPFVARKAYLDSPSKPSRRPVMGRRLHVETKVRWTVDMDNHLWSTYQMYLQDPTITPFKMVPGTIPPLGVCHRIAREAKRTWPKARKASQTPTFGIRNKLRHVRGDVSNANKDLSRTPTSLESDATTPAASASSKPVWPKSESATRRRFKELCKRKFSIAPHYQRLLQSRSPSPFPESNQTSRASSRAPVENNASVSFSTRDLGISLVASSVNEPLVQLTTSPPPVSQTPGMVDDWFGKKPLDHASPQPQPAMPTPAYEFPNHLGVAEMHPRLGSPFVYHTWGPENSRRVMRPTTPKNQCDTIHITGSRVLSSNRNDPFSNIHKRRAQHQLDAELSPGGNLQHNLEQIFQKGSGDISQRRVRIRNRGVTLGSSGTQERFERLFSQPPALPSSTSQSLQGNSGSSSLAVPETHEIKRLGSPFDFSRQRIPKSANVSRHGSSLSDPFVSTSFTATQNNPSSISETLQSFEADNHRFQHRHQGPSYNDQEKGISDAERIRRQILDRPFS